MNHKEKILISLRRVGSRGACTVELFNEWHIMRVPARIYDLKRGGHVIAKRRCDEHNDARYQIVELGHAAMLAEAEASDPGNYDEVYADMRERANDEPDPEPPGEDVEDTFHTSVVWPDDEADFGHDSAVDRELEGDPGGHPFDDGRVIR